MIKYIVQKVIISESYSELDFELKEKFIPNDVNGDHDLCTINRDYGNSEGYPLEISSLIDLLTNMKEKGATHVSLENDVDHYGYIVEGIEIREATTDEIVAYHKLEKKDSDKQKKLEKLYEEINKLKKSE